MKTFLIFVVGFAVLAVAVAPPSPPVDANGAVDPNTAVDPNAAVDPNQGIDQTGSPTNTATTSANGQQPARRSRRRSTSRQSSVPQPTVQIPEPESLTLGSDPIALGKQIAALPQDQQKTFLDRLNQLIQQSGDTMQADFYHAALSATTNAESASTEWKQIVEDAQNYGKEMAEKVPGIDNLFDINTPLATINDILEADPLGAALNGASGIMSQSFGNGMQSVASLSNLGHNLVETVVRGAQVLTSPFNDFPIAGPIKASIDSLILQRIRDGRQFTNDVLMAGANSAKEIGRRKINQSNAALQKLSSIPSMRRK